MKSLSFYVPTHEAGEAAIRSFPAPSSVLKADVVMHHGQLYVEMVLTHYSIKTHERWLIREVQAKRIGDFSVGPVEDLERK